MAKVNICNVVVLDNPCPFVRPFQFEITFECIEDLQEDLEWKITYVGSAESEQYDQTLDTVIVGPIIAGRHMFVFTAPPASADRIPNQDVVGVTVLLLTCAYRSREFIRVGYYVNNEYTDPELKENPPSTPDFDKLQRNILATMPRVTKFKIDWDDGPSSSSNNENVPPAYNTETESNQMGMDPATQNSMIKASQQPNTGAVLAAGENTMDSNSMELAAAKLSAQAAPVTNGSAVSASNGTNVEDMEC